MKYVEVNVFIPIRLTIGEHVVYLQVNNWVSSDAYESIDL